VFVIQLNNVSDKKVYIGLNNSDRLNNKKSFTFEKLCLNGYLLPYLSRGGRLFT